jgi:hypothetical protein
VKTHCYQSLWNGLYYATLLGGEFANCHGQGSTPEGAMISLKLTVNARRRERARNQAKESGTSSAH